MSKKSLLALSGVLAVSAGVAPMINSFAPVPCQTTTTGQTTTIYNGDVTNMTVYSKFGSAYVSFWADATGAVYGYQNATGTFLNNKQPLFTVGTQRISKLKVEGDYLLVGSDQGFVWIYDIYQKVAWNNGRPVIEKSIFGPQAYDQYAVVDFKLLNTVKGGLVVLLDYSAWSFELDSTQMVVRRGQNFFNATNNSPDVPSLGTVSQLYTNVIIGARGKLYKFSDSGGNWTLAKEINVAGATTNSPLTNLMTFNSELYWFVTDNTHLFALHGLDDSVVQTYPFPKTPNGYTTTIGAPGFGVEYTDPFNPTGPQTLSFNVQLVGTNPGAATQLTYDVQEGRFDWTAFNSGLTATATARQNFTSSFWTVGTTTWMYNDNTGVHLYSA